MKSLSYDAVILPDEKLSEQAILASQRLASLGGTYTLEFDRFFPHISLFMLQLKDKDIDTAISLLNGIANKLDSLNLKSSKFTQSYTYFDVGYERNIQIDSLQQQVIAKLNPIRDGVHDKYKVRMLEATGLELENFQNYGYKYIGELFRPHITLTRFNETQASAESLLPELKTFDGSFTKLGLFEVGDNGTCVRKIVEFDLK